MNHVMSDLRARRQAETRDRIVRAVTELLAAGDPATLSMPAVAEASGVSLRTLYRYFPTKAELLDAAGAWFDPDTWFQAAGRSRLEDLDGASLPTYQRVRFAQYAANLPGILAQLGTPGGRELRRQRLAGHRPMVRTILDRLGPELPDDETDRLVDAVTAVTSTSMFVELVDRMGWSSDDAADLSAWMAEALLARAQATGTTHPGAAPGPDTRRRQTR